MKQYLALQSDIAHYNKVLGAALLLNDKEMAWKAWENLMAKCWEDDAGSEDGEPEETIGNAG